MESNNNDEKQFSTGTETGDEKGTTEKGAKIIRILDKIGKYIGIILLILILIDFQVEMAFFRILIAVIVIAGAIFCFVRKYKLRFFTVAALIIAVICLLMGINQMKKYGLFKTEESYYNDLREQRKAERMEDETYDSEIDTELDEEEVIKALEEANQKIEEDIAEEEKDNEEEIAETEQEANDATVEAEGNTEEKNDEEKIDEEIKTDSDSEAEADIRSEEKAEEKEKEGEPEKEETGEVTPDFKEFLDSYEQFMDEYVEFMKKYKSDPGNALTMATDYLKMVAKYEEFVKKANTYNEKEMSEADAIYYTEVMLRVDKKLLEIVQ